MKEILIFAGTTEGRQLSECLTIAGIAHQVCVATEYGKILLKDHPLTRIHCGRMNELEMEAFIREGNFAAVVDATHPYAEVVTENIRQATQQVGICYLRLQRDTKDGENLEQCYYFENNETCAQALKQVEGNILLTTGSKELAVYCDEEELKNRLYVRVLPGVESVTLCANQGIYGKQILALQGPFSTELNEAIIHQYGIRCLVTKASGRAGGFLEKIEAAKRVGISVFIVGRKKEETGYSFGEVCETLEEICGKPLKGEKMFDITLVGIGMGKKENLTLEVLHAIEQADILLGAERMIAPYTPNFEKRPYYMASQILPYLKTIQQGAELWGARKVVILFSGDSGFYSGTQRVYQALQQEIAEGTLRATVRVLPGVSSVSYFASLIGESYHDAAIYSIHGKDLTSEEEAGKTAITLIEKINTYPKTFLLMSGAKDVRWLGKTLLDRNIDGCEMIVGYQLSYEEQTIRYLTAEECLHIEAEGLYLCCIRNYKLRGRNLTHGLADEEFIRDKVPMTKEEIREISICKLNLHNQAVIYDIGSGTGSIAVEIARLSEQVEVFAIEHNAQAVSLIQQNREKAGCMNITVIQGKAPEALENLPVPTHAFIGGSGGCLKEILKLLYKKNNQMRVVINAISMETISELREVLELFPIKNEEITQVQISRAKKAGAYHLMRAENPVWICAFTFDVSKEDSCGE